MFCKYSKLRVPRTLFCNGSTILEPVSKKCCKDLPSYVKNPRFEVMTYSFRYILYNETIKAVFLVTLSYSLVEIKFILFVLLEIQVHL